MLIGTINAFFDLAHVPNLLKKKLHGQDFEEIGPRNKDHEVKIQGPALFWGPRAAIGQKMSTVLPGTGYCFYIHAQCGGQHNP